MKTRDLIIPALLLTTLALTACGTGGDQGSATPTAEPEVLQNDLPSESPSPDMAPDEQGHRADDVTANTAKGACITEGLELTVAGEQGAAGSRILDLELKNTSGKDCQMIGFPGVSIVGGGNGTQIGAPANRENRGTDYVELKDGDVATFTVTISQAGAYDEAECQPTPADGLRVFPPGNTNSSYVAVPGLTGCANPELSILNVGPVA
ncbi:DUF4232 domain-containing protein [Corynebacterium breve]|uniref:DUF4232 domain-containing protein n=1 Tax=Corynebacterium breve TaxID=3049799 RepID=A0ABY8VB62_9CORY|nr:DUF4232 domain-containing protein [Corynebacterium breve]WIM66900.1 DUF4232 domain-containing protein [Corynebacterium breve]